MVTDMLHVFNEKILRSDMAGKAKCERILRDRYDEKDYVTHGLHHRVRQQFATRVSMLPFAGNYSRDKRFLRTQWMCRCSQFREE